MNDSHNADHGATGTPEPENENGQERTTTPSTAADGTPTENLSETRTPADTAPIDGHEPTTEQPTAHTLPYRTGPTPAHFVNQAYDAAGRPIADPYATMGADGYAGQNATPQAPYGQQGYGQAPYGQQPGQPGQQPQYGPNNGQYLFGQVPPAFKKERRHFKPWMIVTGAAVATVIVAGAAGGAAFAIGHTTGEQAASAAANQQKLTLPGGSGSSGTQTSPFGSGGSSLYGSGGDSSGSGSSDSGTGTVPTAATAATAAEKVGLVTIVSTLNYDESTKSAGTGMIMTANGEILTNNHVVQGATSIQVTVVSTGKTYTADVVGTDATNDVAVLKLQDASGLTPVTFGKNATVAAGDAIHSTGNAEGTGSLVTATGTVVATKQSIQVQSESGTGTESLSNLIEISADVVSGDSGGPLRNASGQVIGIVTAASSGTSAVTGYAIPISGALTIADSILAGKSSSTIVIGLPAFLGAEIASTSTGTTGSGVTIAGTVTGSAAAKAGLTAGDTITAVGGTATPDSTTLTQVIQSHKVGDSVVVTYTDASGATQNVTVTLGSGPAA
ncbi:S1C family serine protease [Frondihabitans cladoniiphilus]|uniref:PDZ domain-containing protein n=1 Tax=Frondihabitans cladoniiphilus TaxID=715785 RepID=A0ABP8W8F2_9MICO